MESSSYPGEFVSVLFDDGSKSGEKGLSVRKGRCIALHAQQSVVLVVL